MRVETVPVSSLTFDPSNSRKHSPKNLAAIKGSLAKFGQQKPIVVGKNNVVVAGNGTMQAALDLGWSEIKIVRTELSGSELIAYGIADNRTGELAEWDDSALSKTLDALQKDGFDLDSIGFSNEDLEQWITPTDVIPGCDEDEVPEPEEPICKLGDLWQLGNHRLLCGDSTDVLQVDRLMGGDRADMVFTDPPYGIDLDTNYSDLSKSEHGHSKTRAKNNFKKVEGDAERFNPNFIIGSFHDCPEIFLWGANYYALEIPNYYEGSWVVWDKRGTEELDKMYGSQFELCWSKSRHRQEIARVTWSSFFGHSKKDDGEKKTHPTMKPVKLVSWFFDRWGKPNDLITDLFLGSGSTLIACEKTNRKCYGMEIDPHYCDVIIARWEKYTGKKASLLTGEEQGG